jgi:hypothetical protein
MSILVKYGAAVEMLLVSYQLCVFQNSVCHTVYMLDTPEKLFGISVIHTKYGNQCR